MYVIHIFFRILHFAQNYDIQTAAMLCCAFGRHCPPYEMSRTSSMSSKSMSQSVSTLIHKKYLIITSSEKKTYTIRHLV